MDNIWLEEFCELMAEYRKATYEFAMSDIMEDHDRMMLAHRALYTHAKKALSESAQA